MQKHLRVNFDYFVGVATNAKIPPKKVSNSQNDKEMNFQKNIFWPWEFHEHSKKFKNLTISSSKSLKIVLKSLKK